MKHSKMHSAPREFQFAAVFSEQGDTGDRVIERVIAQLHRERKKVTGFRQYTSVNQCPDNSSKVQDIETGSTHRLSQALDMNATRFELDYKTLEQTANILLGRLNNTLDLAVFNRYGQYESDGAGFYCVIERAIELNIPLLTVVHSRWQQAWHDFAPGNMTTLPPSYDCVLKWCHAVIVEPVPAAACENYLLEANYADA